MSEFNWNDHPIVPAQTAGAPNASGNPKSFSWDDHPIVNHAEPESFGRQMTRATIDAVLPVAGAIGGGLLATPETLGLGTIPGAAMGYAGGKQAARVLNHYVLGDDTGAKDMGDVLKQNAEDLKDGALMETGGQLVGGGAKMLANSSVGKAIGNGLAKAGSKVGELFTGVPEKVIQTYAKYADEIKSMAKASDNDTFAAADQLRSKWADQVQQTKGQLSGQISKTLAASDKTVELKPIVDALEGAKSKINSSLYPEQVAQIDDLSKKISSLAKDGQLGISNANEVKKYLQDQASSAYKPGGIFSLGTESAKAAKSGAAVARQIVNDAEPAIANANNQLANLHDIEDSMNLNMLKEGKPESSIIAAGTGGNPRNAQALTRLSDATGGDMLADSQKLAAMKTFGSPALMAADSTGKAAGRMGLAAGIGFLAGHVPGAVIASAMTSPAALRVAIDGGKITGQMLAQIAKAPGGYELLGQIGKAGAGNGASKINVDTSAQDPAQILGGSQKEKNQVNDAPTKGPDKWANDGLKNIQDHDSSAFSDPAVIEQILGSKKGKDLLIRASDLKPNTKAMDKLVDQIKSASISGGE
jgi:hypothetical protein